MSIVLGLSVTALTLESIESKSKKLRADSTAEKERFAPEQYSSFWSRTSFIWLASTFRRGYTKVISLGDLPPLDTTLKSNELLDKLESTWMTCEMRTNTHVTFIAKEGC